MAATAIAKIAALLRQAGWLVNDKRVERIWRREGLKVPARQPKCSPVALGRIVHRREPSRPTTSGLTISSRSAPMMAASSAYSNIIDEFTHRYLAIRVSHMAQVDRRHRRAVGPVHPARRAQPYPFRQWHRVRRHSRAGVGWRCWAKTAYITPGSPWENGFVKKASTRDCATSCSTVRSSTAARGADRHRELAPALQYHPATYLDRLPGSSSRGVRASPCRMASLHQRPTPLAMLPLVPRPDLN